jgi:hypothetical protein
VDLGGRASQRVRPRRQDRPAQRGVPGPGDRYWLTIQVIRKPRRKRGVRPNHGGARWRAPTAARGNCADPLHRLRQRRTLSALLHRSTRRQGDLLWPRRADQCGAIQQLDRHQWRRRPDRDKPTVILETPRDPDRVSSFLNIRVKDIEAVYFDWSARGCSVPDAAETAPVREALLPPRSRRSSNRIGANHRPRGTGRRGCRLLRCHEDGDGRRLALSVAACQAGPAQQTCGQAVFSRTASAGH